MKLIAAVACVALILTGRGVAHADIPTFAESCSAHIAANGDDSLTPEQHDACVLAIASTYVDGEANAIGPGEILFADDVARHGVGEAPVHAPGNAAALRSTYPTTTTSIDAREWAVDGNEAFIAFAGHTAAPADFFGAARITLKDGLIWEVLATANANPSGGGAGVPGSPVAAVIGPADTRDGTTVDYDNPVFCSRWIGEHGDDSLTPEQHRRCMIAIATTYVDAEDNSIPQSHALYDPRVSRYSMGGQPRHHSGNSDQLRTTNGATSMVIHTIEDRHWTAGGNDAWVVYNGYTRKGFVEGKPDFLVAERIRIRNGLIWEIMIAQVKIRIP